MGIHEILQIIGDCLMAIGVCLGGHHTIKLHKQNKIKMSKKRKKRIKIKKKRANFRYGYNLIFFK